MNDANGNQQTELRAPVVAVDLTQVIQIISVAIDEIKANLQSQNGKINRVIQAVNDTMGAVEKLAKIQGLDYSNDIKDWVSLEKLQELKDNPR